jgi:hypothetical protein
MVTNMRPFQTDSQLMTKHRSIIVTQRVNGGDRTETFTIAQKKRHKNQPSGGKLMLKFFESRKGPVMEYYQERGTTINSETLTDRLKPAI